MTVIPAAIGAVANEHDPAEHASVDRDPVEHDLVEHDPVEHDLVEHDLVEHDPAAHRFTAGVDGHQAELDYLLRDGAMVITHTEVPAPISGRGIASQLALAAFEHARREGWKVRPTCTFAADWAKRHPEYHSLLG